MKNAIHVEKLNIYYNNIPALKNISLDVYEGEFLGIMGPNGGGKSTLLKAILGLISINSGEISIYGSDRSSSRGLIGYVPQFTNMNRQFPITVLETVMTAQLNKGLHPFFKFKDQDREYALSQLEKVNLVHLADRQISDLSGGEFQRLLIARALAIKPKILLLDEPTASVDPSSRAHIFSLLEDLNKEITVVLVTHDLMAISSVVHKLACLNQTLIYHGEPQLTAHTLSNLYGCPVDLIAHGVPHRVLRDHNHN